MYRVRIGPVPNVAEFDRVLRRWSAMACKMRIWLSIEISAR